MNAFTYLGMYACMPACIDGWVDVRVKPCEAAYINISTCIHYITSHHVT